MKDSTALAHAKTFNQGVSEKTLEKIVESLKSSLVSEREMKEIFMNKYSRCKEKLIISELECKSLKDEIKKLRN